MTYFLVLKEVLFKGYKNLYPIFMDLTNISDLKTFLRLHSLKANKNLGQHFLIDRQALEKIAGAGELTNKDTVLEIGPGNGVLTAELARIADRVVSVEVDEKLAEVLRLNFSEGNVEIVNQDFLQFDLTGLPQGFVVVANLPYYLTSHIIRLLLESANPPKRAVLLMQKEVAERVTARTGDMSVLSVSVQFYGKPEIVGYVPKTSFFPAPEVDSAILKIDLFDQPLFDADAQLFFRIVKAGFSQKRKKLINSLSAGLQLGTKEAAKIVDSVGLDRNTRAQELTLDNWHQLYQKLYSQLS